MTTIVSGGLARLADRRDDSVCGGPARARCRPAEDLADWGPGDRGGQFLQGEVGQRHVGCGGARSQRAMDLVGNVAYLDDFQGAASMELGEEGAPPALALWRVAVEGAGGAVQGPVSSLASSIVSEQVEVDKSSQ